ncbi:g2193 [Coccomyxa elongata]
MGARPASADLQAFWRALPSAGIDWKTNCLVLPSGVYFMGTPRYGSKLLYRQHYAALWQQADSHFQEGGGGF